MCDVLEIPFFHRVLVHQDLNDLLGGTFSLLPESVNIQGKLASVTLQALGDDGIQKR